MTSWHYKKATFILKISSKADERDRISLRNVNCNFILSYHLVSEYVYRLQKWKRTMGDLNHVIDVRGYGLFWS